MKNNHEELEVEDLRKKVSELEKSLKTLEKLKQASEENEKKFQILFDETPVPYQLLDDKGYFLEINKAGLTTLGYSRNEVIGRWFGDFLAPSCVDKFKKSFDRFKAMGKIHGLELLVKTHDGSFKTAHFEGKVVYDGHGAFKQTYCLSEGILSCEEIEKSLHRSDFKNAVKKSERQLNEIFKHLPDATFAIDCDGKVIAWNQAIEEMTGVKASEIMGKDNYQYSIPFYGTRRPILIDLIFKTGEEIGKWHYDGIERIQDALMAETTFTKVLGKKAVLWGKASPFYDEKGKLIGAIECIRDITERKEAEKSPKESEDKYRAIFENSGSSLIFIEEDATISLVNKEFEKQSGYTKEEVEGRKLFTELVATAEEKKQMKEYHRLRRVDPDAVPDSYEFQFVDKEGCFRDVLLRVSMVPRTTKSLAALMDITERKKSEYALQESMERFSQVAENAEEWIWESDVNGLYTYSNPTVKKILGYTPEEIIGKKHFYDFFIPEERERNKRNAYKIFQKREAFHSFVNANLHKNGQIVILETSGVPIFDENKIFKGYRGVDNDITLRKETEKALIHSKRHFQDIFNNAPIGIFHTSPEGKVYEVNKALTDMLNYDSVEEFISTVNKTSLQETQYIEKEHRSRWVSQVLKDEDWHSYELPLYKKTGDMVTVELTARSVRNPDGSVKYLEGFLEDITKRKEALDKLNRSEERFRAVAESAVDAIVTTDEQGNIIHFNNSLLKIFGYSKGEILHKPVTLLIPDRFKENFHKRLVKFKSTGKHSLDGKTFLSIGLRKDGTEFPFEMSLATWKSQGENYNTSIIRDVTERRKGEEALRESEAKFRNLVETTPDMIWELDAQGIFTYISPQSQDIMGYQPEDIVGKPFHVLVSPKYIPLAEEIFHSHLDSEEYLYNFEVQAKHPSGSELTIEIRSVKLMDSQGCLTGFHGIARDITERKKAEEELKRANIHNRSVIEASLDPLVTIGPDGKVTDVNYATEAVTGFSRGELIGTDFSDYFTHPVEARVSYQKVFREGMVKDYPLEIQHKNGQITPVLYNASVYRDELGEVSGVFAAARDITGIKKAEEKLKKSENRYHSLYSSMNEGVAIHDLVYNSQGEAVDYIITDINDAYEKIIGFNREGVIGKKASEVYRGLEVPYLEIYASVAQDGKPVQFETYFEPLDKYFRISVTSPDKGRFATIFEDITRRKKAEDETKASLKQKELLLQEIHHRVKNNLQIISSLLNLQESYVEEEEAVNVLQESQNRVLSMAMIHEMLYESEDLSTINFSGYIQHLVYDLFNSYGVKTDFIKLELNIHEINLNIETAVPCGLMISELVSNSLKYAFPKDKGGKLSIEFRLNPDDEFELIIEDDGVGLSENLDFKNTDSLGLRLVNSLVNQIDGSIELDGNHGTKFVIKFKELEYRKRI